MFSNIACQVSLGFNVLLYVVDVTSARIDVKDIEMLDLLGDLCDSC
jgi:hypothetical protein